MRYEPREHKLLIRSRFARRGIYWLPNLFTIASLFSGFYAIVQAMNGRFEIAAMAIFVSMVLDGLDGRIARRILCYARAGQRLSRGERYGFIRFGSRVDVYLPADWRPVASVGDKVYATESILAVMP